MKYFSMFSGIGGFEHGINKSFQRGECETTHTTNDMSMPRSRNEWWWGDCESPVCVGFSEVDKYAISIYKKHFPNHKEYGDATRINTSELPDFDCLVGGFPCQAFSIAGKRRGFDEARGTLFFEIARILRDKRPRCFVLENVKGLLSHDSGKTFQTILKVLSDIGYRVEWQVLNSKDFGVPQNRERVFIVGHFGNRSRRKVFPITGGNGKNLKQIIGGGQGNRLYDSDGISTTIASQAGGQGAKTGLYFINEQRFRDYKKSKISQSVKVGGDVACCAIPVLTPDRLEKRQNGRRFKEDGEPAFTLTAQDKHGIYDGYRIRRLTPTECARLQGFPDDWCDGLSDTQQYKCYGNAVTTNVITSIFKEIIKWTT